MLCYCKSGNKFAQCCKPFLNRDKRASTPLELMRSRYSAYATKDINYIQTTTTQKLNISEIEELTNWANKSFWQHLEIIEAVDDIVEFKAYYIYENKQLLHHERSTFVQKNGLWLYDIGEVYNTKFSISRNQLCICGSGKKYKSCCLKRL